MGSLTPLAKENENKKRVHVKPRKTPRGEEGGCGGGEGERGARGRGRGAPLSKPFEIISIPLAKIYMYGFGSLMLCGRSLHFFWDSLLGRRCEGNEDLGLGGWDGLEKEGGGGLPEPFDIFFSPYFLNSLPPPLFGFHHLHLLTHDARPPSKVFRYFLVMCQVPGGFFLYFFFFCFCGGKENAG